MRPLTLLTGRAAPLPGSDVLSGIGKTPVAGPLTLGREGFEGDEQADRRVHGGPEKAVHHYPSDHYESWRAELGDLPAILAPGGFGENLSTAGLTEAEVAVGDTFRLGGALIQVSQGRQPCWKLNHRFGVPDMARRVQLTGRTGWYYRVLEPGTVAPGDRLELIDRRAPELDPATALAGSLCRPDEPCRTRRHGRARRAGRGLAQPCGPAAGKPAGRGLEQEAGRHRMTRPPFVISIQSQVVFGHVGNSAALFPMQAAGLEVAAIPTVVFSNTPDYPTLRGRALPPEFFSDLLQGARERGLPERADYILTGYIGSLDVAEMVADFVAEAKAANPRLRYVCDPVMGDTGPGLYVPEAIAGVMRDRLLPMADIATPNPFELAWLTGRQIRTLAELQAARAALSLAEAAHLIATGCVLDDTGPGRLETVLMGPEGLSRHPAERLPIALPGTGDLFAGLVVAGLGRGLVLPRAIETAQTLTARALRHAEALGAGEVVLSEPEFRRALLALGTGEAEPPRP
ncbi:Pyridoxal kinase [Cereibacter sphaeroides KD131]|nr:Pyridoxal kinase [Cereibacter sphaeroides KD131]